MIEYITKTGTLSDHEITIIEELDKTIFPYTFHSFNDLKHKINVKKNILTIFVKESDQYVGFKIGYEKTKTLFYSWIGGVISSYRNQGIANQLMRI